MVVVPTNRWKDGLLAVYEPVLDALEADTSACSTKNDGSIFVDIPTTPEAIEAAGAVPLSTKRTRRGWHIVMTEGLDYARENHPSEGRVAPTSSTGKALTPEEQARRDRAAKLKEQMAAIRDAQNEAAESDAESDDDE